MEVIISALTLFIFRYPQLTEEAKELIQKKAEELVELKSQYQLGVRLRDAPEKTSCATAIAWIFRESIRKSLPRAFVENMPYKLMSKRCGEWALLRIDSSQVETADIVFAQNNKAIRTNHMGMMINDRIFHASSQAGCAVIEELGTFFAHYKQAETEEELLHPKDPRDDSRLNASSDSNASSPCGRTGSPITPTPPWDVRIRLLTADDGMHHSWKRDPSPQRFSLEPPLLQSPEKKGTRYLSDRKMPRSEEELLQHPKEEKDSNNFGAQEKKNFVEVAIKKISDPFSPKNHRSPDERETKEPCRK